MSQLSPILRDSGSGSEGRYLAFWCPGCDMAHNVKVEGSGAWGWNGDVGKPTFTPSVLRQEDAWMPPVNHDNLAQWQAAPWEQTKVHQVCHSFVTDGRIQFLGDCTHALAGQTVDLPDWEAS